MDPQIILNASMMQWLSFGLSFGLGLIAKEILTSLVLGLLFRLSDQFNEGDLVIIEGQEAVIISIGFRWTKFGFHKVDGSYHWLYIPNDQVKFKKIEKVVHKGIDPGQPKRRKSDLTNSKIPAEIKQD